MLIAPYCTEFPHQLHDYKEVLCSILKSLNPFYPELFTANFAEPEIPGHLPQLIGPDGSLAQVLAIWRDLIQWLLPLSRSPSLVYLPARHASQARGERFAKHVPQISP